MLPAYPQAGTDTNPFSLPPMSHVHRRRIKQRRLRLRGILVIFHHTFPPHFSFVFSEDLVVQFTGWCAQCK